MIRFFFCCCCCDLFAPSVLRKLKFIFHLFSSMLEFSDDGFRSIHMRFYSQFLGFCVEICDDQPQFESNSVFEPLDVHFPNTNFWVECDLYRTCWEHEKTCLFLCILHFTKKYTHTSTICCEFSFHFYHFSLTEKSFAEKIQNSRNKTHFFVFSYV